MKKEDRQKITIFPDITKFGIIAKEIPNGCVNLTVIECECGYRICVDALISEIRRCIIAGITEEITKSDNPDIVTWGNELLEKIG